MRGYRVLTHPGGDKTFMSFEAMTDMIMKQGSPPQRTFGGKWRFMGGTGKLKWITGGGTFEGKVTQAGVTYEWEGEYEMKHPEASSGLSSKILSALLGKIGGEFDPWEIRSK